MKPTYTASVPARSGDARPQGRRLSSSPASDWSFQSAAPSFRGADHTALNPSFRSLSESLFSAEAKRESRVEGIVFGVIAALSAWPIVLAAQAALALMK